MHFAALKDGKFEVAVKRRDSYRLPFHFGNIEDDRPIPSLSKSRIPSLTDPSWVRAQVSLIAAIAIYS